MAAAAGASGARAWLQTRAWVTPRRLRGVTIGLCAGALAVSTIGVSGSSKVASHPTSQVAASASR